MLLVKIGTDTAETGPAFANILPKIDRSVREFAGGRARSPAASGQSEPPKPGSAGCSTQLVALIRVLLLQDAKRAELGTNK